MKKEKKVKNLPVDIAEEILLNLPVKSLLQFSSVSKPWNSIISESWFVKRYRRRRAAIPDRERIAKEPSNENLGLVKRLPTYHPTVLASCDELWLAGVYYSNSQKIEKLLYLWNPSMRKYKKLPNPSVVPFSLYEGMPFLHNFSYGLGYDSVGDDYKILKIPKFSRSDGAELYSLRSDSWREIPIFSRYKNPRDCVFVSGNLHWLPSQVRVIVSFDLSTEKCGEINYPPTMEMGEKEKASSIYVLKGMLCVIVQVDQKWLIWVMEDYGFASSWNIKFTLKHCSNDYVIRVKPLYFYENGVVLVIVRRGGRISRVFIHQDEETVQLERSNGGIVSKFADEIMYTDSLVAPAMWSALVQE